KAEPNYAEAYVGLAQGWARLEGIGAAPYQGAHLEELKASSKALEIDNTLPEAHVAMSAARGREFDWAAADMEIQEAFRLNPGSLLGHSIYSDQLRHRGRAAQSIAEAKRALALDPLSPFTLEGLGDAYRSARQYDLAIEQYEKALEL